MLAKSGSIDPLAQPYTAAAENARNNLHQPRTKSLSVTFFVVLGVCCLTSGIVNVLHVESTTRPTAMHQILDGFLEKSPKFIKDELSRIDDHGSEQEEDTEEDEEEEDEEGEEEREEEEDQEVMINQNLNQNTDDKKNDDEIVNDVRDREDVQSGYLSCEKFGGPADEFAQEMVYWKDIESDRHYVSPFHVKEGVHRRYMTFEPDEGGWNNVRMALESDLGLAIAMGRTLVMPPEQKVYLLNKNRGKDKTEFSFADFFPMHEIAAENDGLEIISMQEFLEAEGMTGNLRNRLTGQVSFPPDNRTNWNGLELKPLKEWLRNVTYTPLWRPGSCLAAFPASTDPRDIEGLQQTLVQIQQEGALKEVFLDNPPPINSSTLDRMRHSLANRTELCIYDEDMQNEPVVHFMCYYKMRMRMLVHFYAFLFFESYQEDLWMKRFIRDHVRYNDEIQCAAARIVHAMREYDKSRKNENTNNTAVGQGEFDTFHIRRGDFQYKSDTRIEAQQIYNNTKDLLSPGATIYIATDEKNKKFFDPLRQHYHLKFLDDFKDLLVGVNTNYYGLIDQLVAARGRLFFGCWHSTFTGYIHRLRGYHSTMEKAPGYEKGILPTSYYYAPLERQYVLHTYAHLHMKLTNREFPTSWRGIDESIGDSPNSM